MRGWFVSFIYVGIFFCLFKSMFLCYWQLNHTTTLCRKRYEMQKDLRNVLAKKCKVHNISQTWTSVTSPCPCFYLLLYLATQLHAKTDPKRLIAEDKANKALIFLFTKKRESRKSRERQEEKTPYELWLPPIFPIKIYFTYSIELFLFKLRAFENLHLNLYLIFPDAFWIVKECLIHKSVIKELNFHFLELFRLTRLGSIPLTWRSCSSIHCVLLTKDVEPSNCFTFVIEAWAGFLFVTEHIK